MKKGIFCLEASDWFGSMKRKDSVKPALELLYNSPLSVPYIHRNVATKEELKFYLKKWTLKKYKDYPILYLAFHGAPQEIMLSKNGKRVPLEELLKVLKGKCQKRLIHFSSCDVFNIETKKLKILLKELDALALSGYKKTVDWLISTAFELLFFSEIQNTSLTILGIKKFEKRIKSKANPLIRELGFKIVTNS